MDTFDQRADKRYQKRLTECFDLESDNGLKQAALEIAEPFAMGSTTFTKEIGLDFMGCTATTLFERSPRVAPVCHFDKLTRLADSILELNKKGFFVRFRILLLYPFSAAAQIRIQAEQSMVRGTIDEPFSKRGSAFIERLSEEDLLVSSFCATLRKTVGVIQEWLDKLGTSHPLRTPPNKFSLRFSVFNPIVCGLRINNRFFFDVYSYAKQTRHDTFCSGDTQPVIEISRDEDLLAYQSFCDHFEYLWNYDATLDDSDVIDRRTDYPHLRNPREIDFAGKVSRLAQLEGQEWTHEQKLIYRKRACDVLKKHCPPTLTSSGKDYAFLSCAWTGKNPTQRVPNPDASELFKLWEKYLDGADSVTSQRVQISLVKGKPSEALSSLVFETLRKSTIGVVVLSPELRVDNGKARYFCTPNVYYELGYLMSQVSYVFVFLENRIDAPSNIGDLVHIKYEEGKIAVAFLKIFDGLRKADVVNDEDVRNLAREHFKYIEQQVLDKKLTSDDLDYSRELVEELIEINLQPPSFQGVAH